MPTRTDEKILDALHERDARLAAALRALADALEQSETVEERTGAPHEKEGAEAAEEKAPSLSLEDVRRVAAEAAKAGRSKEVREALAALGVSRLSDLAPEHYEALVEAISHA